MTKAALRERIWTVLTQEEAARFPGANGRIPNFTGAPKAAAQVQKLPVWERARPLKANPDSPQRGVRALALQQGKTVYMAAPRSGNERCLFELRQEEPRS